MARPREQARRRADLVEAALRAIAGRGVAGLRIKDVAAEASLSPGLITYYYRDLDELLAEVHQSAADRFYWTRSAAVQQSQSPRDQLRALVEHGLPSHRDDLLCTVLYELHVHAARSPAHAALLTSLFDREVSLYARVLRVGQDIGVFSLNQSVDVVAANAVALEDAYGLHIVGGNARIDRKQAADNITAFLETSTGVQLRTSGEPADRSP